MVYPRQNTCFE